VPRSGPKPTRRLLKMAATLYAPVRPQKKPATSTSGTEAVSGAKPELGMAAPAPPSPEIDLQKT
jgi:hypothetical protein